MSAAVVRAAYREIAPYRPDRRPAEIDLSDNTNLWGAAPAVHEALRTLPPMLTVRYPAVQADALRAALADYLGVAESEVVTGCGSDDVLDSALRALAEPGDAIAFPWPTFGMVPTFARMNGLLPVPVELGPDHQPEVGALLATGARLIYLCSPNNPTGVAVEPSAVERLLDGFDGVVLIDEAYAEFAGGDWAVRAPRCERLLVVRTLSKAFGLAGLRVGYATAAAELVAEVEKSRGPYKVSAVAERAALAALSGDGLAWARQRVADAVRERDRLAAELRGIEGLRVLPSAANFLLLALPDGVGADATAAALRERGVAVRPFAPLPGIGEALRVTAGPRPLMSAFLAALREVLACA